MLLIYRAHILIDLLQDILCQLLPEGKLVSKYLLDVEYLLETCA